LTSETVPLYHAPVKYAGTEVRGVLPLPLFSSLLPLPALVGDLQPPSANTVVTKSTVAALSMRLLKKCMLGVFILLSP
jgi:hypothetical protein